MNNDFKYDFNAGSNFTVDFGEVHLESFSLAELIDNHITENDDTYIGLDNKLIASLIKNKRYTKDSKKLPKKGISNNIKKNVRALTPDIAFDFLHILAGEQAWLTDELFKQYLEKIIPSDVIEPYTEAYQREKNDELDKRKKELIAKLSEKTPMYFFRTKDDQLLPIRQGDLNSYQSCFIIKDLGSKVVEPCSNKEFIIAIKGGAFTRCQNAKKQWNLCSVNSKHIKGLVSKATNTSVEIEVSIKNET
jgi:hypothetical protein